MQENESAPDVLRVCPDETELDGDVKRNIQCPVEGCGRILPQSSSLRFHLVKVHQHIKVSDFVL